MAVSLEFIQSQLKAIQSDLREMRFAADVDRRNTASLYNNLVAEFGTAIGGLDAKVEIGFEVVNERIDRLEERVGRLETRFEGLEGGIGRVEARIGGLEERMERTLEQLEPRIRASFAQVQELLNNVQQLLNRG